MFAELFYRVLNSKILNAIRTFYFVGYCKISEKQMKQGDKTNMNIFHLEKTTKGKKRFKISY